MVFSTVKFHTNVYFLITQEEKGETIYVFLETKMILVPKY